MAVEDFLGSEDPNETLPDIVLSVARTNYTAEHLRAPYELFMALGHYHWDPGTFQVPVAPNENGAFLPAQILQVASPYGYLEVEWVVGRVGEMPLAPSALRETDQNRVLGPVSVWAPNPRLHTSGDDYIFMLAGKYKWHLYEPITELDGLYMGTSPALIDVREQFLISPSHFVSGLLPASPKQSAGPSKPR